MRFLEKLSKSFNPESVPGNTEAKLLSVFGIGCKEFNEIDAYTGVTGEWPVWVTPEEASRTETAIPPSPSVEELLKDPNVAAVVEAAGYLAVAKD